MIKDIIYGYKLNEKLYAFLCTEIGYDIECMATIFYYVGINLPNIKTLYSQLDEDKYKRSNNLSEDKKVKVINTLYDWNDFFSYDTSTKTFNSIGYEYHKLHRNSIIPVAYRKDIKDKKVMNALIEDYENLFLLLKLNNFKSLNDKE